ncbi:VUT family protein [Amycolatopsis sp. H20-H5]|uniref:VUT family protein n=1 Tax=Amycolatopsis sp. H20-H5 TaxID=3046309 RepID=UPI002DBB147C|nr:VUT family protein [Amycolatopsis sp. H20-H5]MEC3974968.1 VUT family protein [Amycolatopsis sp. H20-H5]
MTTPQHPPVAASPLALGRLFSGATGRRVTGVSLVVLAAYVGTIVTANWASTHWSALLVGVVAVPAGTLWAGATFTLRDMLHECLGPRGVLAAIAAGAGLSWLLASPQIAMASVLAFTVSELVGSIVYGRLRAWSVLGAVIGSNMVGLGIDSVLFVPLAFGSFAFVPGQILGKTVATVLTVAVLVAATAVRRAVRA